MFKILTSALPVSDFHDGKNTPLARSAYQHAAMQMMSVERGLLGIEALKQASASICSDNPDALGVELQAVVDSLQGTALEPYERDSLLFAREALAIASNPTLRFTVSDSITGALADTLNCVLNSEVCLSRFAKRESAELRLASAGEPSSSSVDPPRL